MLSKRIISEIKQLHQLKYRQQSGLFIAEGEKVVDELLTSSFKVKQILCLQEYANKNDGIPDTTEVTVVSEAELARISLMKTPNKVLAIVHKPANDSIDIVKSGVYVVLDGIRDPGNMGTIIRTALWFHAKGIICSEDCVDVYNPKVVQGAMGALFHSSIIYSSLPDFIRNITQHNNANVIAADLNGEPLQKIQFSGNLHILIIGNEASGISPDVLENANYRVCIPGGGTESLNAAVACGIMLNALYQ